MQKLSLASFIAIIFWCASSSAFDGVSPSANPTSVDRYINSGKWTLVAIWALDCVACEQQKPELSSINKKLEHLNVVGLSVDGLSNIDSVNQRLSDKPVSFDNVIVELKAFQNEYQSRYGSQYVGTPTYILYSPDKQIDSIRVGPMDFSLLSNYVYKNTTPDQVILNHDLM